MSNITSNPRDENHASFAFSFKVDKLDSLYPNL